MSTDTQDKAADDVRRAFSGLNLDQKFSTLIRIELDMLGDAVETVVSVASKAVDEIANAFSECSTDNKTNTDGQPSTSEA